MADRFDLINFGKSVVTTTGGTTANVNIDANTLFIDGTNNRVGVGTNAPTDNLDISGRATVRDALNLRNTGAPSGSRWSQIGNYVDGNFVIARLNDNESYRGNIIVSYANGGLALCTSTDGAERIRIANTGTVTLASHSGNGSTILGSNGTIVVSTWQEGGRTYETHNFNTYPNLYSSIFINMGVSSNIPPSSGGNGYRFVMGAGDTGGRGFDLVGTSSGQLYYRARENGTWYLVSASIPSDYRIKQTVTPITSPIDTLKQVKPVSYRYKNIASPGANNSLQWADDGQNHLGFIAHELREVIPSAVNGEKDAVTDVGGIQPQTLNVMPIVALLTSALQEAVTKIETLEARIEALENK